MSEDRLLRPGPLPGVRIAWVDLDRPPEPLARLEAWLSAAERARASRFRFDVDRRRFLAARGLLRRLLAAELDIPPAEVTIEADVHGKPRLGAAHGSELRFNLSHAAARGLYGFAVGREIGVDVENLRPLADMDALASTVFSPAEHEEWRSVPPGRRVEAFFAGWTRKEAFVKALGRGLDFPLGAFDVALTPDRPAALLRVTDEGGPASRWSMVAWTPEDGFVAALVAEARAVPVGCDTAP
jgi:4'-phosphopantetheinyl transferase